MKDGLNIFGKESIFSEKKSYQLDIMSNLFFISLDLKDNKGTIDLIYQYLNET